MPAKSHGRSRDANGNKTPEYTAWAAMKQRCTNPKNPRYKDYGGRGITVCAEWMESFDSFYEDMGPRPSELHSLERIKNDQGYTRNNCRWATKEEQALNQRDRPRRLLKTDALMLDLVPKLSDMGFSLRRIGALFGVGYTTIERILDGKYENVIDCNGVLKTTERRKVNQIMEAASDSGRNQRCPRRVRNAPK